MGFAHHAFTQRMDKTMQAQVRLAADLFGQQQGSRMIVVGCAVSVAAVPVAGTALRRT